MPLLEEVRYGCAQTAAQAQWVRIDMDAIADEEVLAKIADARSRRAARAELDPVRHYLEGEPADVADYLLALDAINFGSGWFPTLRKRLDGGAPVSGYFTVAWGLTDYVRAQHAACGGWALDGAWLRAVDTRTIAAILGQRPDHELMSLYAQALRELGRFLGERRALDLVAECGGSAERLAQALARGMAMFDDRSFYKRAQIVAADLALAGVDELHRPRPADDLRGQPRPPRAALRWHPGVRASRSPPASTPANCSRQAAPSVRSAPARCTPAS